ncbi:TonB-dependent hemoglobin/transferrin/lactoferrin family receptor [Kerstersia gyiorum]|uniref:TonB-dependent hemoglobin/transferrin/lactoferrin family receptor n=1 Tax=Kerstersia gyiorum TaxID=206506 RepID=UPI00209E052F|nr:TonB-dependent hemoglobin/transferrin/lactoferrin family receptor [Kerstersia gyiorum]MCP1636992.1 hemoglobin/transferrin/lactoferrin receptor protein [Kerstersia gyiorum]MCP1670469.1 hemoglobin/transferrin/lactoferrin receptor protein [Kerstersia gyiorum]MCP1708377.1 hemoglobin/transferrin/lactoferrin receptor protein [Kerstersia gyiorum]
MRTLRPTLLSSLIATALTGTNLAIAADNTATDDANTSQVNTVQESPVRLLTPTVITATRFEQDAAGIPPSATTTSRETLDERFIHNFQDLGQRAEPGIEAGRSLRNGNTQINIRGLQGARVLTLVDGIRLPDVFEFTGRDSIGQDMVDFTSLKSVDIVRGPGSTLYGSSALAGIVGLRTLDPSDVIRPGGSFGARGVMDYRSDDGSRGLNVALAGLFDNDNTAWLIQAGGRKGHEYENQGKDDSTGASRTKPNPQKNSRSNVLGKLQHDFVGGHKLGLTGEYRKTNYHSDRLNALGSVMGTATQILSSHTDDSEKRYRLSMEYDYKAPDQDKLIDLASARVYYSRLDSDQFDHQVRSNAPRYERNGQYRQSLYGLSALASKQLTGTVSNRISAGGEWWQSRTEEFAAGYPESSTINLRTVPKTKITQFGLFMEDEIGFLHDQVSLTPGIRYDHYEQNPLSDTTLEQQNGTAVKQRDSRFSPKLLATWYATDNVTLFVQYAQGFRAPNLVEVNGQFSNTSSPYYGYTLHPNPDLKPETSSGYELGARWNSSQASASLTFFDTRYKNFINMEGWPDDANPAFTHYQFQNVNRVRIYGAEAQGQWQFARNWDVWGSLAWSQGRNREDNSYLNSISPLKTVLGLRYSQENWGAESILTLARKRDKVKDDTTFKAPGYGTLDLIGWVTPPEAKGLRLQAGVFNLFDKKYWRSINVQDISSTSAGLDMYTEAGRNVQLSVSYSY